MAKTGAERVREHRQRRLDLVAGLEAENSELRRQVADLASALEIANSEIARLSGARCLHPSEAVDNGRCTGCGEWL